MSRKAWIALMLVVAAVFAAVLVWRAAEPGHEPSTVRIGAILPLTGQAAEYGQAAKKGIELAVKQRNSSGGIRGQQVEVAYEDSKAEPKDGVAALQKLITVDKVRAVIGAMASSVTLAIAPVAERNRIVLISPASSSPEITNAGDYIFRNEISERDGARRSAELYFEEGFASIAILHINNDYGVGVAEATQAVYSDKDGAIVAVESFAQGATDLRAQLVKIKASSPEAILLAGYKEMILALKQMKELGIGQQVLSTPMFEDPEILERVGELAEGAIYSYYGVFFEGSNNPQRETFLREFQVEFGEEPSYYAALGYDAAAILLTAVSECEDYDADSVRTRLYGIRDFPGVTGTTTFDENGDVSKPVILKSVQDGSFVVLHPHSD